MSSSHGPSNGGQKGPRHESQGSNGIGANQGVASGQSDVLSQLSFSYDTSTVGAGMPTTIPVRPQPDSTPSAPHSGQSSAAEASNTSSDIASGLRSLEQSLAAQNAVNSKVSDALAEVTKTLGVLSSTQTSSAAVIARALDGVSRTGNGGDKHNPSSERNELPERSNDKTVPGKQEQKSPRSQLQAAPSLLVSKSSPAESSPADDGGKAIKQEIIDRAIALNKLTDKELRKLPLGRPKKNSATQKDETDQKEERKLEYLDFRFPPYIDSKDKSYKESEKNYREPHESDSNIAGLTKENFNVSRLRFLAGWGMVALPPATVAGIGAMWLTSIAVAPPFAAIGTVGILVISSATGYLLKEAIVTSIWKNKVMDNIISLKESSNTGAELGRRLEIAYSIVRDQRPFYFPKILIASSIASSIARFPSFCIEKMVAVCKDPLSVLRNPLSLFSSESSARVASKEPNDPVYFLDAFRNMAVFVLLNYSAAGRLSDQERTQVKQALQDAGVSGVDYRFDQLVKKLFEVPPTGRNKESPLEGLERRWNWWPLWVYEKFVQPLPPLRWYDTERKKAK